MRTECFVSSAQLFKKKKTRVVMESKTTPVDQKRHYSMDKEDVFGPCKQ